VAGCHEGQVGAVLRKTLARRRFSYRSPSRPNGCAPTRVQSTNRAIATVAEGRIRLQSRQVRVQRHLADRHLGGDSA
jgi:hypothetical protein